MFGTAVAGLVLGHLATYAIVYPDDDHRGAILASTGHAYLPALTPMAWILAAAAAATIVGRAWDGRRHGTPGSFVSLAGALALTQAVGFVGQEIVERLVSGSPLHDLISGPVLVFGVGAQVVLGVAGASIAAWLGRSTERLADSALVSRIVIWRPRARCLLPAAEDGFAASATIGVLPGRSPPSV